MGLPKLPRVILDPLIRRKAALHRTPLERYQVRIARTVAEHEDAFRLVRIAYAYDGLTPISGGPDLRILPQHVLPESTILVAYEDDVIVGTMTVTLDSPAGLPLDHDYVEALDELRTAENRLVEYGALAVVRRCWHSGVPTLMNMAAHHLSLHVLRATHCVIGVRPSAAPIYRALFDFQPLGPARWHRSLHSEVQGLVLSTRDVRSFLAHHFRRPMTSGLWPHEHICDFLPACVRIPEGSLEDLVRWKLPWHVFQQLFVQRSDRLATLDEKTRKHLEGWRSLRTLVPSSGVLEGRAFASPVVVQAARNAVE